MLTILYVSVVVGLRGSSLGAMLERRSLAGFRLFFDGFGAIFLGLRFGVVAICLVSILICIAIVLFLCMFQIVHELFYISHLPRLISSYTSP